MLEEGRVPDRNARGRTIEGEKRGITRKECKRLRAEFEVGDSMAQKTRFVEHRQKRGCWKTEERCLKKETYSEKHKAMHEENFLRSWLREDVEGKAEDVEKVNKKAKDEECKHGN